MINYDKVALCSTVLRGKVRYFKEYSLNGRIVGTEYIPYSEFVRLLHLWGANTRSGHNPAEKTRRSYHEKNNSH